jgi:hypothetical protein
MKIKPGLVFAVPLGDGSYGFGQVIEKQGPIYYMAGLDVRKEMPELSQDEFALTKPVVAGNCFDVLLKNGRWTPIGVLPLRTDVPFPCFKVKIGEHFYLESWDRKERRQASSDELHRYGFRTNYGPIMLEHALQAHFGLRSAAANLEALKVENIAKAANCI